MLKVLIVDDDKLTRKGLIASMPWSDYAMEVIGEAANGVEALKFLEQHRVDLVLSDLEMPLISGLDFIRKATSLYPDLAFAVLSIHGDFEYIQEALRLGAIDYIAKVQLDRENFSSLLERISARIRKTAQERSNQAERWEDRICHQDAIEVVLTLQDSDEAVEALYSAEEFIATGRGIWFCQRQDVDTESIERSLGDGWVLLTLKGVIGMRYEDVYSKVLKYRKEKLFYEYKPKARRIAHVVQELSGQNHRVSKEQFAGLKQSWTSLDWIRDPGVFDKMRSELKESSLTTAQLLHIALAIEHTWNHSYSGTLNETVSAPPSFQCWQEIEDWLTEVYEKTLSFEGKYRFSHEVTESIFHAERIIKKEYDQHLFSGDVARRVNMSRSYFSQCFHEIIGCSFSEYLRRTRIAKAKDYLEKTSYSIQQIAEFTGYFDEKYFSRIFKKSTDMLPSEYRKLHRK